MADQISDQVYGVDVPTGWKLDTHHPREVVFEVGGLPLADEHRLQVARSNFPESRPQDFVQEGKDWVHWTRGYGIASCCSTRRSVKTHGTPG